MSITMIGLDTAKSVFQVHAVDSAGQVVTRRKLRRNELIAFFEKQASCAVVMEACGAAHHWARVLTGLGHDVKLIAPEAVRPFVKKGKKNDAADAAAICEAASRPGMRFVPIKSLEQQGVLALHSARSLLVKQQTMLANAIRGLATEFGLTVGLGMGKLGELMALVDADEAVPEKARQALNGTVARLGVSLRSPSAGRDRWLAGTSVRSRTRACHYRRRSGPAAAGRPRVATSASAVTCSSGSSPGSWPSLR